MDARTKWDQLDKSGQQKLIDKYRDIHTDHGWWEGVYEQFKEECAELGIEVDEIYFSGFWSQGDGACFEGSVRDWEKFLTGMGKPELYTAIKSIEASDSSIDVSPSLSWKHSGHYYHEHCTRFDDDVFIFNPFDEGNDALRHTAWAVMYGEYGPLSEYVDDMIGHVRGLMRNLYKQLECEYGYLSSDEQVTAYIVDFCEEEIVYLLEIICQDCDERCELAA